MVGVNGWQGGVAGVDDLLWICKENNEKEGRM